ncbi:MAG: NAD(P)/FAD-dependent oxidoreductase [Acidobacteria bacterium]|nr:NAD(P)/FAD-dependent oxidoreductase [Acidobacteriota bacterium]
MIEPEEGGGGTAQPSGARYDVIVAGAGPAGAVAARTLAAAGLSTVLVDRAAFPRNKPCGGGISARALRRLPWLEPALDGVDVHRLSKLHLEGPGGARADVDGHRDCVLLVRRVEFDHALVRAAIDAGARLEAPFEITQVSAGPAAVTLQARDGRRLSAPHVIAADGVHSVIAKRLGVNARWPRHGLAIDMMEETPVTRLAAAEPDVLWVAYAYDGLDGYAYVFPKTRHVNVGIGCLLSHFDAEVPQRPYELQEAFVSSLAARGVLRGQSDRSCFTPFLIPVGGPLRRAWSGRVLFAGDAGGFVHAVTAEGIYYAMVSGELAGRALADALRRGTDDAGPRYERSWRAEIGAELREAVLVQRYLFASHARVARVIRGIAGGTTLTEAVLQFVRGETTYAALRRRIFWRLPMAVLQMARERIRARAS